MPLWTLCALLSARPAAAAKVVEAPPIQTSVNPRGAPVVVPAGAPSLQAPSLPTAGLFPTVVNAPSLTPSAAARPQQAAAAVPQPSPQALQAAPLTPSAVPALPAAEGKAGSLDAADSTPQPKKPAARRLISGAKATAEVLAGAPRLPGAYLPQTPARTQAGPPRPMSSLAPAAAVDAVTLRALARTDRRESRDFVRKVYRGRLLKELGGTSEAATAVAAAEEAGVDLETFFEGRERSLSEERRRVEAARPQERRSALAEELALATRSPRRRPAASKPSGLGPGDGSAAGTSEDLGTLGYVLEQRRRYAASGRHTFSIRPYIQRKFTPSLLAFLAAHPDVGVRIYAGSEQAGLSALAKDGFTERIALESTRWTNFSKVLARDPATGKTALALLAPAGRSYKRSLSAHFLYTYPDAPPGWPLDPARIRVFDAGAPAAVDFAAVLAEEGLDPDVVVIGNPEQLHGKVAELGAAGGKPWIGRVGGFRRPELAGTVYAVGERRVLSVKIDPYLYGDRAGELVRAAAARSTKPRTIIFTGTAGSLGGEVGLRDVVVPGSFARTDGTVGRLVSGARNLALDLFRRLGLDRLSGVHLDTPHGSVDSILFEDAAWLRSHGDGPSPLETVEVEAADVAEAAAATGSRFYLFLRVSDVLDSPQADYAKTDLAPRPRGAAVDRGEAMLEMIRESL
ncbi:MAG: hypothetical protein HYZ75_15250 [Elusimicrobia bacterium]|nr:hypothetical protein [Elusimicrobiota bacterium]